MELFEDAGLMFFGNPRTSISHSYIEPAIDRGCSDAHLAGIGKLDGVAHKVQKHLREALLIAKTPASTTITRVRAGPPSLCST